MELPAPELRSRPNLVLRVEDVELNFVQDPLDTGLEGVEL
jgi:hypothetical protein